MAPTGKVAHAFVGREAQLETLRSAAVAAVQGDGSLLLVGGEPGIGKTRLVEQIAREAGGFGTRPLWASCWHGDGVPAFWPWRELIRAHMHDQGPEAMRRELGAYAAEILRLAPALAEPGGDEPAARADTEEARFRLFEAVTAFLHRTAEATPLLAVIDDLHWADRDSLLLLRFVARQLRGSRLVVVGTYREGETGPPLRELLASVADTSEHVVLGGLEPREVADLVGSLTGVVPSRERVASLHRRTNGNPLFVRELVRLAADGSGPGRRVPAGVRDVIQRRLDRLSEPCRTLLLSAAALGQQFRLSLLEAVSGLPGDELGVALEEAAAARLVEELPGAVPRYRFTHALVAEVLQQTLGADRRRALHQRTALVLESVFRDDLEPRLGQLAHHFRLAGDWPQAIDYATRAGHRAYRMLAYGSAAGHFEEALEMLEALPSPDQLARCRLLLAIANAQMASAEIVAARETYARVAELARSLGAPDLLARAALGVGLATTVGVVDHVELRLLEDALQAVGASDGVLRARLLARLAMAMHGTVRAARRRDLSDLAVAVARRMHDPTTLAYVLLDRHVAIASHLGPEERLALSGEVIRLARQTGSRRLEVRARTLRIGNLLELGDMDGVRTELEISEAMSGELHMDERAWHVPLVRAGLALLAGRLDEAERLAADGLQLGRSMRHPGTEVYHGSLIGLVRFLQGRLGELEGELRCLVNRFPSVSGWRAGLVLALSEVGRHEEARQQFDVVAADDFASEADYLPRLYSLSLLAVACDAVGDARRGAILHELLRPHRAQFVQLGQTATGSLGAASHYVALTCCAMASWQEAVSHFETAIEMNAHIGALPFVANSRFQCARALRAVGDPEAEARARDHQDRAEEMARTLGLSLWRGGAPPAAPLSVREWEVARLIASGLTNVEIADRLHISKRTVETHVEHVRNKLDLNSRAAIVTWVVTQS